MASEEEAVAQANDSDYGLNASVWTTDHDRGRRVASKIKCGTVNVNEGYAATFGSIDAPMGGMKDSGLGRRQGRDGIRRFVDVQSVGYPKRNSHRSQSRPGWQVLHLGYDRDAAGHEEGRPRLAPLEASPFDGLRAREQ